MADAVISTEEHMEQVNRTIRENLRRQRFEDQKKGRWHKKGGGQAAWIFFKGLEVPAGIGSKCDAVTAEVLEASCGSNYNEGDIVTVWAWSEETMAMPDILLFGDATTDPVSGKAVLMKTPQRLLNEYGAILDIGNCIFRAVKMFCTEGDVA